MFYRDCDCYNNSTSVITPPVKSESIKSSEDTTCNLTMKVNIGDSPKLFIMYCGRFYLMYRCVSTYTKLPLSTEVLYHSTLVFDETGKVYKNGKNSAEFIQKFVDENGVKSLLLKTTDLSEMTLSDALVVLRTHRHSVVDYLRMTEQLTQFNL